MNKQSHGRLTGDILEASELSRENRSGPGRIGLFLGRIRILELVPQSLLYPPLLYRLLYGNL